MRVEELLEQIDDILDKAKVIPLSGGKCALDGERLRNIVDDIRGNLPGEVRQAKAIVADRGDIVSTAKREAEAIIRAAEERARRLVEQEEIVKQAQAKANELMMHAQQKSREMRRGASDFSEDILKRTEESLASQLSEIRQARQVLRNPPRPEQGE